MSNIKQLVPESVNEFDELDWNESTLRTVSPSIYVDPVNSRLSTKRKVLY